MRCGRQTNDIQAAVVLRIFTEFANGKSPRRIALTLNQKGIDGPQGLAGAPRPSTATPPAARVSSTTSFISAVWYGTVSNT
jgi:hypothetical protein